MLKRVVLFLVTLCVLSACYAVYMRIFGHFSQLEELDEELLPHSTGSDLSWTTNESSQYNRTRELARRVFGRDSWQAKADIALNWERNGVVIYILDYVPVDPQTMRLMPFSLVYTEPPKSAGAEPQIVTLEGKEAVLEFDRPVDPIRMTSARPVGGKISGNVQIQADRGTADLLDDVVAYTDDLEFNEQEQKIWTASPVRIVSGDSVMTGTGGEMQLVLKDSNKPHQTISFQGIRSFVLHREVQINMLAASGGGFLPTLGKSDKGRESKEEKPRTPVTVNCVGPFTYELETARAQFSDSVMMIRQTGEAQFDRLLCDELWLFFGKTTGPVERREDKSEEVSGLQFHRALATGRAVRLLSDAQSIEAIGSELEHDATIARTVLRGDPQVVAAQQGNVLHGRELIFTANEQGQHSAEARGSGSMEARDPDSGELQLIARWGESARFEPQGERQQLLTLHGQATVDQPGKGTFGADRVKVWLVHSEVPTQRSPKIGVGRSARWVPSRIDGIGNVSVKSDEFELEAPTRLEMVIEDSSSASRASSSPGTADRSVRTGSQDKSTASGTGKSARSSDQAGAAGKQHSAPNEARLERGPARLHAERIRIRTVRDGERTEIAEVWTDGGVSLDQPPDAKDADAVMVRGETLYLKRVAGKSYLQVTGRPAHVELNELKVDGAQVGVDQPTGVAWVEGKGTMVFAAENSFDGKKLDQPAELTIAWGSNMVFTGESAEFGGGVEARQGNSRLRCQRLEAKLTERLDISAPKKRDQNSAKIKELICSDTVTLDKVEFVDDRLEHNEHLESNSLRFNNATGQMVAQGPGVFRSHGRGPANAMATQPATLVAKNRPVPGDPDSLLVTQVQFSDRMEADRDNQIARFFGHIEAIRSPVDDENQPINPDKLPEGAMSIRCNEELQIGSKKGPGDKAYTKLLGTGNVQVEAREYYGSSDRISYNQLSNVLIFESRSGTFSTFYRQLREGVRPDVTRAFKINYNLATGEVKVEGGVEVDLQEREADRKNMQKTPVQRR